MSESSSRVKMLIFAGSTAEKSLNIRVAIGAARFLKSSDSVVDVTFINLKDYPLPLYGMEDPNSSQTESILDALVCVFRQTDALFIVTPEHNGFFPALIKNLFDWISRKDISVFKNKPVSIASASPGRLGGLRAIMHLKQFLGIMGFLVTNQYLSLPKYNIEMFDEKSNLIDVQQQTQLESILKKLIDLGQRLR